MNGLKVDLSFQRLRPRLTSKPIAGFGLCEVDTTVLKHPRQESAFSHTRST